MKIDFSSENKAKSDYDFPRLQMDKDERARIVCIEQSPTANFVHTLKAPQIINGEIVMKPVRQKDGSYKDEVAMDFVGRHLCFGNANTLVKNNKDPENCPTCAKANENDNVGAAARAFAMHIIRYKIQPGGFKVQEPFSVELLAWRFADKVFNTLVDISEEHGDLRKKDLNLTCTSKMFQNLDIQVGSDAIWLQNEEFKTLVTRTYAENKTEDLNPLIGRKISREMALEDIDKVLTKWAIANGAPESSGSTSNVGAQMNLDDLLSDKPASPEPVAAPAPAAAVEETPAQAAWEPPVEESKPIVDVTPSVVLEDAPAPVVAEAPAAAPVEEKKSDPLDFDSILEGL